MPIRSKKGGIVKVIVLIIALLVIIGGIYAFISRESESQNSNLQNEEDAQNDTNINVPTTDLDKPPRPPE